MRSAWIASLLVGCTFGGSDEDPTGGLSAIADPVMDGGGVSISDGGGGVDAMVRRDASVKNDASVAADASVVPTDGGGGTNSCKPATAVPVCDPVKNMGCDLFAQCDLNAEATAQSGRCVSWFPGLFGCSSNGLSTSCGGGEACIEGACQKLCYCDADCATGKKCTGMAPGPTGPVKVCR